MPESTTTTTTEPAEPTDTWGDGVPFDAARAKTLITKLRQQDHDKSGRIRALEDALRAVANRQRVDPALLGEEPAAAPGADLAAVAAVLGVDNSDPAAVVEAALQARLNGELYAIFAEAGADPQLTRAVLNDSRALVGIDLGDGLHNRLTNIVADAVALHPQLKRQTFPSRSGAEFPAGSGGVPPLVSRDSLAWLDPETIGKLRASGQLSHLGIGGDKG